MTEKSRHPLVNQCTTSQNLICDNPVGVLPPLCRSIKIELNPEFVSGSSTTSGRLESKQIWATFAAVTF